jgi:hypothetical protein
MANTSPVNVNSPILAGPGKPHSLVAPLSLGDTLRIAIELREQIEAEHPELIADAVGANASGEARKVAREKAEANVIRRRGGYDAAWVAAQKMAVSVSALGKYPGYERFDEISYARGDLDHCIDERPVFAMDEGTQAAVEEDLERLAALLLGSRIPGRPQPPTPEWGVMLADSKAYMETAGWLVMWPGLCILSVVLAFNLLGDGLRDAFDPKL